MLPWLKLHARFVLISAVTVDRPDIPRVFKYLQHHWRELEWQTKKWRTPSECELY